MVEKSNRVYAYVYTIYIKKYILLRTKLDTTKNTKVIKSKII